MAKKKRPIEQLISEIVQNRLEAELHKQLGKTGKAVVRQRKKTSDRLGEIKFLPEPGIVEAEIIEECQETVASTSGRTDERIEQGQDWALL